MRGKLLLIGVLSVLLVACGKKDESPITPIEVPASPYRGEIQSEVSDATQNEVQKDSLESVPVVEKEEPATRKLAVTADEWSDDLMSDDIYMTFWLV